MWAFKILIIEHIFKFLFMATAVFPGTKLLLAATKMRVNGHILKGNSLVFSPKGSTLKGKKSTLGANFF